MSMLHINFHFLSINHNNDLVTKKDAKSPKKVEKIDRNPMDIEIFSLLMTSPFPSWEIGSLFQ